MTGRGAGAATRVCTALGWGDVRGWRPEALETAADDLRHTSDRVLSLADELDTMAAPAGWHGQAAEGATRHRRALHTGLETLVAEMAAARRALYEAADTVAGIHRRVGDLDYYASQHQLSISPTGQIHDLTTPDPTTPGPTAAGPGQLLMPPGGLLDLAAAAAERRQQVSYCAEQVRDILSQAEQAAIALNTALEKIVSRGIGAPAVGGLAAADTAGDAQEATAAHPPPAATAGPTANAAWWAGYTPAEKDYILAHHPDWVAGRDGIDAHTRDLANRRLLGDHRADLQHQLDDLSAQIAATYPGYGQMLSDLDRQRKRLQDKLASLNTVETILARRDRQLLYLDLTHERAEAAIAVGDLDTAAHVAVFTPGFTSTVQGLGGSDQDMSDLRDRTSDVLSNKGEDASVAAVTWLGYQAPQWSTVTSPDNSVASAGTAQTGGHALARFLSGINASRHTPADLTALGHSYGSTTTGYALRETTGVDRVAFFGSPGIGTDTLTDLHAPSGEVYTEAAGNDPWAKLGAFGPYPGDIPGVHEMPTAASTTPAGQPLTASSGHTHYLDPGTTSQYDLAALVAGHPEDLATTP